MSVSEQAAKSVDVGKALSAKVRQVDFFSAFMTAVAVICSGFILVLLVIIAWLSWFEGLPGDPTLVYTLRNYQRVFFDPFTFAVLLNTAAFSVISLAVAFFFGVPAAWLAERTNFPGKTLLFTLMTASLLIPGFAVAMGWLLLLHPRIGVLNQWAMALFGSLYSPISITTVIGMGWVQGLSLAPLAFIMTAAVFRAMDPSLEEASQASGASLFQTIWTVTLPLVWPGLLAAAIYILTIGIAAFDVPVIIGWSNRIFTFSTYIYLQVSPQEDLPRYGVAAAFSAFVLIFAGLLSWWYARVQGRSLHYEVITGKGYRPKIYRLGRGVVPAWLFVGSYILLSQILPLGLLIWASLLRFFEPPTVEAISRASLLNFTTLPWNLVMRGAQNTFLLMVFTPTLTVPLSLAFSWVVLRSRIRGRFVLDFFAFLPHTLPSIVFGVGALLLALFVLRAVVPIYGTLWVLLFVYVIVRLSYGTRMTNSALIQVHRELEEAGYASGAGTWGVVRRILVPILTPAMLYSWVWIALLTYRELTLAILLSTPNNITLPVVVWSLWISGGLGQSSALTIIMLVLLAPIIAGYWFFTRRTGIKPEEF